MATHIYTCIAEELYLRKSAHFSRDKIYFSKLSPPNPHSTINQDIDHFLQWYLLRVHRTYHDLWMLARLIDWTVLYRDKNISVELYAVFEDLLLDRRDAATHVVPSSFLFSSRSIFLSLSLSLGTPSPFSLDAVFFSESPFEEVGHANVGGRVSGRPRASATTTSPRYQGQNTGRRMSLLFSANEEVASHSANIMKAPLFLRHASRKRSSVSVPLLALPVSAFRSFLIRGPRCRAFKRAISMCLRFLGFQLARCALFRCFANVSLHLFHLIIVKLYNVKRVIFLDETFLG